MTTPNSAQPQTAETWLKALTENHPDIENMFRDLPQDERGRLIAAFAEVQSERL